MRVDLFDVEIDSLRWFSTFTQRSLGDADEVEIAPAAELAPEHRELAEIAATDEDRPDIAELLPVDRFRELLDLVPEHAQIVIAAEEDTEPSLRDHWADVSVAFHDEDAHHLYVKPDRILETLHAARRRPPVLDLRRPADPDPRPGRRLRRPLAQGGRGRAREAHPLGLHDGRRLAPARRRRARRVQPRPPERRPRRRHHRPDLHRGQPARRLRRPRPQARRLPRAPADPPPQALHAADAARAAGCCARSPTCERATSSSTRTTGSRASPASTPRPSPGSRATTSTSSTRAPTRSSCRSTSWRRSPATSAPTARTRRSPSSAAPAGRR